MQKIFTTILSLIAGASVFISSANNSVFLAKTTEAGTLLEVVGDRLSDTDSLVVEGPVNAEDFKTMMLMTLNGNTSVINLEKAEVEDGEIPSQAFNTNTAQDYRYNSKLKHIIFGPSIERIGKGAFANCATLRKITFYEQNLKELGNYCFMCCWDLGFYEPFILPEGLEYLPHQIFYCGGRGEIVLPSTLKRIEISAFYGSRVQKMNIPESLEYIGDGGISNTSINEIIFAKDQQIEFSENNYALAGVFSSNFYLKKLYLPDCTKDIPAYFAYNCHDLEDLRLPADVEVIGKGAFADCVCLKNLVLPDKLVRIEDEAFNQYYYGGSNLIIPASVQYLGFECFDAFGFYEGGKVICPSAVPAVCAMDGETGPFGTKADCATMTLVVPEGSGDSYRAAPGWSSFGTIEEVSQDVLGELLGVEAVEAAVSDVKVSAANGEIAVSGGVGEMCEVYTADGRMAASVRLSGDTRVALPQGLYIVKAAGKVCKVRI